MPVSPLRVLLVDDNKHMRLLLAEVLRALDIHHLFEAADGAEGMEKLRTCHPIDLVITDLKMAPIDGIAFVRMIRNAPDSPNRMVPVLMTTGHSTARRVAAARDAGVTEFLTKPVSAQSVIDRLNRVIMHPRPFIQTGDFFGPDRRRRADPAHPGPDRRKAPPPTSQED